MSDSESEQVAVTNNLKKRTLDTDDENEGSKHKIIKSENSVSESTEENEALKEEEEEEDNDYDVLLPLTFSFCIELFSDPIFTNCNHCFCKNCDIKHQEKNEKCFASCEEPTLGVNSAMEIKKRIAKEREQDKAKVEKEAADIEEKVMTMMTTTVETAMKAAEMVEKSYAMMQTGRTELGTTAAEMATKAVEMLEKASAMMHTANTELAKLK